MSLRFEWDSEKARRNVEKHAVSFEEEATVRGDPLSLTIEDPLHSQGEVRYVTVGETVGREIVVVVHTDRGTSIRIISARRVERGELMSRDDSFQDAEILREYDFRNGERGKYARRYAEGSNVIVLSPDVAEAFPDSESVNEALRALKDIADRSSDR